MQSPASPAPADSRLRPWLASELIVHWRWVLLVPITASVLAVAASFLIPPSFTSTTVFLPPQQQQSAAASALSQLGALSGLAGAAVAMKNPAEQYVSLLQSTAVADRLIDQFGLQEVYGTTYRFQARKLLADSSRIALGKKDGLITVEVDDNDPKRAADIANRYVEELRRLTSQLALTEAQQRRAFFEAQLKATKDHLTKAQQVLQASGFSQGALKADAKAAAEGYARLRAEAVATEVRLQTLRRGLSDATPEVQQAASKLTALRDQIGRLEESVDAGGGSDYISRFREFKYQEAMFEFFARQFELARLDESREGSLIQVVDAATPAEWKSRPKRWLIGLVTLLLSLGLTGLWLVARHQWRAAVLGTTRTAADERSVAPP